MFQFAILTLLISAVSGHASTTHILDSTFGDKGITFLSNPLGGKAAVGYGIAEDKEGHIFVSGVISDKNEIFRMAVWRLDATGRLDPRFGKGGILYSDDNGWALSMDVDDQGRILMGGFEENNVTKSRNGIVKRILPSGQADSGFGKNGSVILAEPKGGLATVSATRSASDGKIYLAGMVGGGHQSDKAAVWRLTRDGRLDEKFGQAGLAVLSGTAPDDNIRANAIFLDGDFILVAGNSNWKQLTLWKLDSRGVPSKDFSEQGLSIAASGVGRGIAEGSNGEIFVGGFRYTYDGNKMTQASAVISKFYSNGAPDSKFGSGGSIILPHSDQSLEYEAFAVARSGNGRIYLGGYTAGPGMKAERINAALWSLNSSGELDESFGRKGLTVLPNYAGGSDDKIYALTMSKNAGILACGYSSDAQGTKHAVVLRIRTTP